CNSLLAQQYYTCSLKKHHATVPHPHSTKYRLARNGTFCKPFRVKWAAPSRFMYSYIPQQAKSGVCAERVTSRLRHIHKGHGRSLGTYLRILEYTYGLPVCG